jgi:hypothetical protein
MKTRIIQTRFWEDDTVLSVSKNTRILWIFLLTNEKLGMTNYVKIPDSFIQYYTGLTSNELKLSKEELQSTGKVFFYNSWIYILNLERENKYRNSPKLEIPYKAELSHIPENIILQFKSLAKAFDSTINSTSHSTSDSLIKPKTKTHKSKTKNQNSKGVVENEKLQEIIEFYNQLFNKKITSSRGFESNFRKWIQIHDITKIKKAIGNARQDKFWRDKMTLTILFRMKNGNGEDVDYIEDLSSKDNSMQGNIAII